MTTMRASRPIRRVLIANRGEIACRIARTCRAMGIRTTAVFSDADQGAPHTRAADAAVRIGPPEARASYLDADALIAAARATACDAVHPGYGFLAENAAFARAVTGAGLTFIGPSADVIEKLGSKESARHLAERAGVPVVPSYAAEAAPASMTYPVLVKASAGGGGKGMRIVRAPVDLPAALDAGRREAAAAFGDDTLLIERYVERARHVEIQIFGDHHGTLVHMFERECSVQRRHQKIIEESPSPAVGPELRRTMGEAALRIAREVGYENAGTVEFILAPDGAFYFLEVNTRLQVEHPVTELVTGLDLVRLQLQVAAGEPLGLAQDDLQQRGHAVEARLYAEDPAHEFLPQSGQLLAFCEPGPEPGLRIDSGVTAGQVVPSHYDPMLAKVVTHGPTRREALAHLGGALERLVALGPATNRALLIQVLSHPAFVAGEIDTHFLERHESEVLGALPDAELERAALAAALADHARTQRARTILPDLEPGWRNSRLADPTVQLHAGERELAVALRSLGQGRFLCHVDGQERPVRLLSARPDGAFDALEIEDASGVVTRACVATAPAPGGAVRHHVHTGAATVTLTQPPRFPDPGAARSHGSHEAPMPGRVVKVLVEEGAACTAGQALILLEAMKMEHAVRAQTGGRVTKLYVREGDPVEAGAVLVAVEPLEAA